MASYGRGKRYHTPCVCLTLQASNSHQGISLSLDQYRALLQVIPELNEQLRSDGHEVGHIPAAEASAFLGMADKSTKPKSQKANIDATSDEEEADD